jgi:hypothetical protein
MQSKTLMVVGMHRSGTSLITNWLQRCGLQVGEKLAGADIGNVDGHFEDVEFLRMHEEILVSNDLDPKGLVYDKEIDINVYQREKLKSVIKVKNQRYKQWGWKEPRTCLFLKLYRELLPGSKYLVIVRDYPAVVNSLLKRHFGHIDKKYLARGRFSRFVWLTFRCNRRKRKFYSENTEYYLKVWIDYNEHILSMLAELSPEDYMVVNYSQLKKSDTQVFSLLTNTWRFALKYFSFKDVYKEELISSTVDLYPFITDYSLLSKAKTVEDEFKKYMKTS